MLEVKDLHKSFGANEVLKGIHFRVEKGEVIAVLGSSGSGKTTLLRCISFLERADRGELLFDGFQKDITRVDKREVRRLRMKMGFVFQGYNLFQNKTAAENVMEGLTAARGVPVPQARKIAMRERNSDLAVFAASACRRSAVSVFNCSSSRLCSSISRSTTR